jgi:hypothetical protein
MIMISKGKGTVEKSFNELLNSINDTDLLAIEARILMFRFLGEVDKICKVEKTGKLTTPRRFKLTTTGRSKLTT